MIVVNNIGKQYRIAESSGEQYDTLRDRIADGIASTTRALTRSGSRASARKAGDHTDFWALRDLSFSVAKGTVLGVIGRNGAGKSTLLKLLSRITEPTEGSIRIKGRVASLLEVGTGFHPELTGRENIFLNGAILGMTKSEVKAKFNEIVEFAEVAQFLDTPVKRYSSGMYVRLAFSVAASLEPEILIVDEVLAVGDAEFQRKCLGKMRDVSKDAGRTVLFVSHAMGSIRSLCTEVLWLEKGRIRMMGAPADVINSYLESASDVEESGDLSTLKRIWPGHGETLAVSAVHVNGGEPVLHGEPLTLSVHFKLSRPAGDLAFEIGLNSLDGIRVLTLDSNLDGTHRSFSGPHEGVITVRVPELNLQLGKYSVDVSVRSGEQIGLDHLQACAWVSVLPGPRTSPVLFRPVHGVRQPGEWNWAG